MATKKALAGIKVADFSTSVAGPLIGKVFGDFGAEVIKIESKVRPDIARVSGPYKDGIPGLERGSIFISSNTSKRSFGLRLDTPKGAELARKVAAWADVAIETFAPGTADKLGIGYETLRKIKPDLIMLSHSGQGQTGPNAGHPAWGFNLKGLAGFTFLVGWPDREPAGLPPPYTDVVAPWWGIAAVLSALEYRRRTGKGQYIDLAQFEASLNFLSPEILDYTVNKRIVDRVGNRSTRYAPHGAYRCKGEDAWCAIAVKGDAEWQKFCAVLGNPKWTKDAKFGSHLSRVENADALDALINQWTVTYSPEEVMTKVQAAGVAAGAVETPADTIERDPQLKHRRYYQKANHPEIGECCLPDWPFKLSETPSELGVPPLFNQDLEYVCKEILHISDEQFVELLGEGVFE